jgi:hypothetical protein
MHSHRHVRALLVAGLASFAVACSSSSSTNSDAGADSGADAGPSNTFKCGAGGLTGVLRVVDGVTFAPLVGATVSATGCSTATTDDRAFVQADFAQGQLVKVRFSATGYIPEHVEVIPQTGGFNRSADMFAVGSKTSVLSGWTNGSGYILVAIASNGGDAGPCNTADNLTVSVKGHPEIAVGYLTDLGTRNAMLTMTSASGLAVLGPVPPGTYEIDAVKAGCTAGMDYGKFTWPKTTDVEADTVSAVQLKLP